MYPEHLFLQLHYFFFTIYTWTIPIRSSCDLRFPHLCVSVGLCVCWQWGLRESLVTPACSATLSTADSSTETLLTICPLTPHSLQQHSHIMNLQPFSHFWTSATTFKCIIRHYWQQNKKKTKWNNIGKLFLVQILKQRGALQRKQKGLVALNEWILLMSQLANNNGCVKTNCWARELCSLLTFTKWVCNDEENKQTYKNSTVFLLLSHLTYDTDRDFMRSFFL